MTRFASLLAILTGAGVLLGWGIDVPILRSALPGATPMKVNTAIGIVLFAVCLSLLQGTKGHSPSAARVRMAQIIAVIAMLPAVVALCEYAVGRDFGVDNLIFSESPTIPYAGRMAHGTAIGLILLGSAILVDSRRGTRLAAHSLALGAGLMGLLAVVGYAYGVDDLLGLATYTRMAIHTGIALIALSAGLLCLHPTHGVMGIVTSDSPGGIVMRRFLPAAVIVTLGLGWVILEGQRAGHYTTPLGMSLVAMSLVVVLSLLALVVSRQLRRAHLAHQKAEEALREVVAHKAEFYRRTILAATEGKLVIAEPSEVREIAGQPHASWEIMEKQDLPAIRQAISSFADSTGMDESRVFSFAVCLGEAATNAYKHAGGGTISLHRNEDSLMCVISDRGPGINAMSIPDVALVKGYSTAGTLGMGYKFMISLADRIHLATGSDGTIVAIEMKLEAQKTAALAAFLPEG